MKYIDSFLNSITMYKLVLYSLMVMLGFTLVFSLFGLVPYNPLAIVVSTLFITVVCMWTNELFARVFAAPANVESTYITALILALIISPMSGPYDLQFYALAFWASALAMGSKYIFAIRHKHLFNPAAFGVAATAIAGLTASWWVATLPMMPVVAILGLLIAHKIRRMDLALSCIGAALAFTFGPTILGGGSIVNTFMHTVKESPILFFSLIMLTEPLTMPATRLWRVSYGALVGFLFVPLAHLGAFYFTPETALLCGNLFSYLASSKQKLILTLISMKQIATDTYEYTFASDQKLTSQAGQYMEWTLAHANPDSRGNRRYFTVASSPTEGANGIVKLGVKFYPNPSTFKTALSSMKVGDTLVASQIAGDFILPYDPAKKLVFIAGGIGVTPFRSMIKYLSDRGEKRDVALFYCARTPKDFGYADEFNSAEMKSWLKTIYVVSDAASADQAHFACRKGFMSPEIVVSDIPDFHDRMFYISGPSAMVSATKKMLLSMGIRSSSIKTDYFPGF